MTAATKTARTAEIKVNADTIKVGDKVYYDGAYRVVAKVIDCVGYWKITFNPTWGAIRPGKGSTVYKLAA
jgi:hypothetical protein